MAYGSAASMRSAKGGIIGAMVKKATAGPIGKMAAGAMAFMPGGAAVKSVAGLALATKKIAGPAQPKGWMSPLGSLPGMSLPATLFAAHQKPQGGFRKKYRRMNPANVKALKRAMKRQDAFIGLANDALRGSGYRVGRASKTVSPKKKGK